MQMGEQDDSWRPKPFQKPKPESAKSEKRFNSARNIMRWFEGERGILPSQKVKARGSFNGVAWEGSLIAMTKNESEISQICKERI